MSNFFLVTCSHLLISISLFLSTSNIYAVVLNQHCVELDSVELYCSVTYTN